MARLRVVARVAGTLRLSHDARNYRAIEKRSFFEEVESRRLSFLTVAHTIARVSPDMIRCAHRLHRKRFMMGERSRTILQALGDNRHPRQREVSGFEADQNSIGGRG